jgi:hypothetical protein
MVAVATELPLQRVIGSRPVGFSYVVAAPVWKAAYRLVLPKEGGAARLQGWAVVRI